MHRLGIDMRWWRLRFAMGLLLAAILTATTANAETRTARLAIIIDDIGYNRTQGLRAANLAAPVTLAILPHTAYARPIAEQARQQKKEVMLHMPMESEEYGKLDTGGLHREQLHDEFIAQVRANLDAVPHISGVNNHMGSYLTRQPEPMHWLMQELAARELFFIDSKTHADSVAAAVAREAGIPTAERHVFLDNAQGVHDINRQFNEALRIARRHGYAIAIGHPHKATLSYLEHVLPLLAGTDVRIVPASALVRPPPTAKAGATGSAPALVAAGAGAGNEVTPRMAESGASTGAEGQKAGLVQPTPALP